MPSPQPTTNQLANAARINYRLPSLEPAVSVLARRVLNASNAVMIDPDGLVINGNWTFTGNFTPTPAAAFPGMYALGLDGNAYVWAHFVGANSDERLYISISRDGVNWFALNQGKYVFAYPGYVAPGSFGSQSFGSVRDTAITWDGTQFVVVHTPCDSGVGCHSFRVLTSPDLIHWTHVYDVPCPSGTTSGSGGYGNPVWITDTGGTVHVMFCGSTTGTITNSNCYVWEIHPSVAGVYTAWSTPVAITSLQYTAEIFFFLSPDDANYHVVKSNGNASGQIEEWYCSTLTGSYTKTSTIGLNSQEGLNILHLPANGSAAEWRIYSEYGNGISVGYFYQDLTTGFTEIGSQHAVNSTLVQRNGKFSLCRVPIGAIPAFPTTGTLGAQDYDAATLASPKITGTIALSGGGAIAVATNLVISPPSGSAYTQFTNAAQTNSTLTIYDSGTIGIIGQYLCVLDSGWTSGGILFNGAAKTTCAFIGETGSHTLDIVLGSGSPALAITNNARNANVATMDNSGNLTLSGGTLIVGTLPTSNPHVAGQLYTAAGVVMQSTG